VCGDRNGTTRRALEAISVERIDATRLSPGDVAERAASVVFDGGTLVFPKETVYALGCDPQRLAAVERIRHATGRLGEPLTLHVATVVEALEYCGRNIRNFATVRLLVPGPITLIIERPRFVDARVTAGLSTLGIRVPDHPLATALLERCGPLAALPARRQPRDAWPECDLLIENGPVRSLGESTVLDLTADRPRMVREGVITMEMLERTIGRIDPPFGVKR